MQKTIAARQNPWRRVGITAGAMVLVALSVSAYRFFEARGVFAGAPEKTPAACHAVAGVGAVAAIVPDKPGTALIAAENAFYLFDGSKVERLAGAPKVFRPVAMAKTPSGLTVVFEQDGAFKVSSFTFDGTKLTEFGRLTTDVLTDPAAIAAVDDQRFYLVNKHTSKSAFGRWLDDAFLLPRAEILYFDGMKFVTVAERLNSPAGLALSADQSRLFTAQELPRNLVGFDRNVFMGSISHAALFAMPAAPRQIVPTADGNLIVTAWPKAGAGAVYRVRLSNGVPQPAELLYGTKSGAVTAAAETKGHLLIGSAKGLLDCTP